MIDKEAIYYYQRGVASYLIAKKLGVSNTKIRAILVKHGIKLRDHEITNTISAKKRSPSENHAITKKAAEANLGSVHSSVHRTKLAASRQNNPKIDPVYELPLVQECSLRSIVVIPQKSFYKYNVDLYLPKENVVIEIFGGNFHNKPQAVKLFKNKMAYLSMKKIPVVVVWADKINFDPSAVLDVAVNSGIPLTIIEGDGSMTNRGYSLIMSR